MNLDDFKEPWKQQQRDLADRTANIMQAVHKRMTWFNQMIWLRDLGESTAGIFVFIVFLAYFFAFDPPIAKLGSALTMLSAIEIIVVVNWARLTGQPAHPGMSLQEHCTAELARVDRQIWLLRNINWWYTGPCYVGLMVFMWGLLPYVFVACGWFVCLFLLGWFIYAINQRAINEQLLPLRENIIKSMTSTDDDNGESIFTDAMAATTQKQRKASRRGFIILVISLLALAAIIYGLLRAGAFNFEDRPWNLAPKKSPFTNIQFVGDQIHVTYNGQAYEWLGLDKFPTAEIVASSKNQFPRSWQKRTREDLVEVLWGMGYQPGDNVRLRLKDLKTAQELTIENAPMTEANRNTIYNK